MSVFDSIKSLISYDPDNDDDDNVRPSTTKQSHEEQRNEFLKRLYEGVEVKNRKYRLKTYKQCFVGSEAVDFMVQSHWTKNRQDAVRLGRRLQADFDLFQHVVDPTKHKFDDKYLFFRFNNGDDPSMSDSTSTISDIADIFESYTTISSSSGGTTKKQGLMAVGEILRHGVSKKYNTALDVEGFYANEAVDYLLSTGLASSRQDGVSIGMALQSVVGCIRNAKSQDRFADARLFFAFATEQSPRWKEDLAQTRDFFKEHIQTSDHTYRLKMYKHTFTGVEAVDTLLAAGASSSRQDAVLLGRALMVEYNLFGHVCDEHELEDTEVDMQW